MKSKSFTIEPFGCKFLTILCDHNELFELRKTWNISKIKRSTLKGCGGMAIYRKNKYMLMEGYKYHYVLWLNTNYGGIVDYSVMAHEIFHIVYRIFKGYGAKLTEATNELYAYTIETLLEQIQKFYEESYPEHTKEEVVKFVMRILKLKTQDQIKDILDSYDNDSSLESIIKNIIDK